MFQLEQLINRFHSFNYGEILEKKTVMPLPTLIHLLEEKLPKVISTQRNSPSYQRALLSTGGVKEDGMLKNVTKIDSRTFSELQTSLTRPQHDNPEAYIEFLGRCARIEKLANQQENLMPKVSSSSLATAFTQYSRTATFFPYNGEGITDYGWGCCWRATQTSLSAIIGEEGKLTEVPTFEKLFHLFGSNHVLKKIYIDFLITKKNVKEESAITQAESLFSLSEFSPYQHSYGWSNPFVSQLMFHYYGLNSNIITINGMPDSLKQRHLPEELLDGNVDFPTLTQQLIEHFFQENPLPIVIDDGKFAMAIVGVKTEMDMTTILFADPHIKGGANNLETRVVYDANNPNDSFNHLPDPSAGLYSITFDSEGRQMDCSVNTHELMFSQKSYEETQFFNKPWMFTFPER